MTEIFTSMWARYALIVELARRMRETGSQFGKTALQKLIFLLQTIYDIKCGYSFRFYTYGPFSAEIASDLDMVEAMRGVCVKYIEGFYGGYEIVPGKASSDVARKGQAFLENPKVKDAIDQLVGDFGALSARDLELRSTIVFVDRIALSKGSSVSKTDVTQLVMEIKPKFSSQEIGGAVNDLLTQKAVRNIT